MSGLGEQIAVLDGLGALDPNGGRPRINRQDGRIGQQKARVDQYGRLIMPGVLARRMVIDASQGGNYSGGSSYAAGLPLMPSSVGLASALIAGGYGKAGLGLASSLISGGYGRAGLGAPLIDGGYGHAGLGGTGSMADEDLAAAAEAVAAERVATGQTAPGERRPMLTKAPRINRQDGRIGQQKARVDQYGRLIMPGVLMRQRVIDASQGGNYSGGSSYAAGLPLMPSSVGLANLPSVLPHKYNVVDPSGGANYTGGASYTGGMPLLVSSAGLAACAPCSSGSMNSDGEGMGAISPALAATLATYKKQARAIRALAMNSKTPLAHRVALAKRYKAIVAALCQVQARTGAPMSKACRNQALDYDQMSQSRSWA